MPFIPEGTPQRCQTYVELPDRLNFGGAEYKAWEVWLVSCGFPIQQCALGGWVARDPYRNTVSVKTLLWKPEDEPLATNNARVSTVAYVDENHLDVQHGVMTIQLNETPPPFPEPVLNREETEEHARSSLASLWSKLAEVGDLSDADQLPVAEYQHSIDRVSRLLDSILAQRRDRADGIHTVGATFRD